MTASPPTVRTVRSSVADPRRTACTDFFRNNPIGELLRGARDPARFVHKWLQREVGHDEISMIDRRKVPVDVEHARVLLDGPRSEMATALCGRLEKESSKKGRVPVALRASKVLQIGRL